MTKSGENSNYLLAFADISQGLTEGPVTKKKVTSALIGMEVLKLYNKSFSFPFQV